jgi:hypothetical protein
MDDPTNPLALALILIRVTPFRREIGTLNPPCVTRIRFPETSMTAFPGSMVPSTSILRTATVAPSVGAVNDTFTVLGVDAPPQPATMADPAPSRTASNALAHGILQT